MNEKVLNYSHQRIKSILQNYYNLKLVKRYAGYKGTRYGNHISRYNLVEIDTDKVILENITLNGLRPTLTQEGFPLKERG